MKYQYLILWILGISIACSNDNKPTHAAIVGSDKDKDTCQISVGEAWSKLEETCVHLSKQAIRLNPQSETMKKASSAFILFRKGDKTKVELFMPKVKDSKLLEQSSTAASTWQLNDLKLSKTQGAYTLKLGEQLLYQSTVE